jgi:hypothetical protein
LSSGFTGRRISPRFRSALARMSAITVSMSGFMADLFRSRGK